MKLFFGCLILFCMISSVANEDQGRRGSDILSQKLEQFDTLHLHDLVHLHSGAKLAHLGRRTVEFTALSRRFVLLLRPHSAFFHPSMGVEVRNGSSAVLHYAFPRQEYFEGVVSGERDSFVHTHINDRGILTASISIQDEHYRIEPSQIHVQEAHDYHMIIYKMSDHKRLHSIKQYCQESTIPRTPEDSSRRVLRQSQAGQLIDGHNCRLHVIADYKFYRHLGQSHHSATLAYMVNVLVDVNRIYRQTVFGSSSGRSFNRIGLQIANVTIYTQPTQSPAFNRETDVSSPISSNSLLEELSNDDWTSYCLVHLFTFQVFTGQTLGVAYTAVPNKDALGGICSQRAVFSGVDSSTNVGLSSFKDRQTGRPILQIEGDVIVAHEIGHNFGTSHDPGSGGGPCDPPVGRNKGKYLMYPAAVDGTEANNLVFSPCSRLAIGNTLEHRGHLCFAATSVEYCGNWFLEAGEGCDGGPGGDACCTGDCKLRPQALCSDTNEPCCRMCQYANSSVQCAERSTALLCKAPSFCSGFDSSCPPQQPLVGVSCPQMGVCKLSNAADGTNVSLCQPFCTTVGLEPCQCTGVTDQCKLCCQPESGGACTTYGDTPLSSGALCAGGYCFSGECVQTYADLSSRLRRIFTTPNEIFVFARENLVGCIGILTLIVWFLGFGVLKFILIPLWNKKLSKIHGVEFKRCCGFKTGTVELSESSDPRTPSAMTPLKRQWSTKSSQSRGRRVDHFYGRSVSYRRALRSPLFRPNVFQSIDEDSEAVFLS